GSVRDDGRMRRGEGLQVNAGHLPPQLAQLSDGGITLRLLLSPLRLTARPVQLRDRRGDRTRSCRTPGTGAPSIAAKGTRRVEGAESGRHPGAAAAHAEPRRTWPDRGAHSTSG